MVKKTSFTLKQNLSEHIIFDRRKQGTECSIQSTLHASSSIEFTSFKVKFPHGEFLIIVQEICGAREIYSSE